MPHPHSSEPLRSIHTNSLPQLLSHLGISLVVSTYQAGKVVILRADDTGLNTHFRLFPKPMGMAIAQPQDQPARIALGSRSQIYDLRNVPAAAPNLEPRGKHDACFLTRSTHTTGDIDIHEMAWGSDRQSEIQSQLKSPYHRLWLINTRFSCLCTLDDEHSFVPCWRPPFVSAYAPEDRCHLNGLALVNDQPRYVTTLGQTDTPGGWREHKADGGILMDITDNRIIAQGLSMPHSPRWYRNQLWVLESGCGTLAKVDQATGELTTVAELPGFTRGLSFYGPFAFIGLSKVRESAVFSGIPITKCVEERVCGVWVVNIETSETVGFLKFEDAVQEIFAVEVLQGIRFPEIVNEENELLQHSYVLPDESLKEVAFSPALAEDFHQWLQQGDAAYHTGDLEQAAQQYRRCLERNPQFITARYNLGVVLVDQKQWGKAIAQLKRVIAEDTQHAEAHNALGTALLQGGASDLSERDRLNAALHHYQTAVTSDPSFKVAQQNLAAVQQMLGAQASSLENI